ncbi:transcriptional repressor [Tistrella mobilis]|uniref:transcriptional repressor n=1 Tax=Tistrella mobilis TaxID=171437 RepID=UPI003558E547
MADHAHDHAHASPRPAPAEGAADAFPQGDHDHHACVATALDAAERICAANGARLTDLRRRVLELVLDGHEPVRAYDVLDRLKDERSGAAPPTVYRALDFLLEQGLVHRIESMNAFVGCGLAGRSHAGQFLICDACGRVAEVTDAGTSDRLAALARAAGFTLKRQMVELHGLCPACTTAAGKGDAA